MNLIFSTAALQWIANNNSEERVFFLRDLDMNGFDVFRNIEKLDEMVRGLENHIEKVGSDVAKIVAGNNIESLKNLRAGIIFAKWGMNPAPAPGEDVRCLPNVMVGDWYYTIEGVGEELEIKKRMYRPDVDRDRDEFTSMEEATLEIMKLVELSSK